MGLSTSKQTTKTNQTQTQNQQTSGTQVPIVPANLQGGLDALLRQIGDFGSVDPSSLVAGASPLQQQAWAEARNLGGWQGQALTAAQMARQAGQRGPNLAGNPALVAAQGYAAPTLASPQGYGAARAGAPQAVDAQGYDPAMALGATIEPIERAQVMDATAQSLLTNLGRYMSPYTSRVVDTTLSEFDDQSGRVRAAQAAQAARNGAFGGSRYAIREAQTEADLARTRASAEAGLRDQAFQVGAGLSADDANRRQTVSIGNADRRTGVSTFNAGQGNARALAQAGFDQQTGTYNADAATRAAAELAGSRERTSLANAELTSRHALDLAGRTDAASQFGLSQGLQRALAQAGLDENAARYGSEIVNRARELNANFLNDTARFNAGQQDNAQTKALQAAQILGGLSSEAAGNRRADLQTLGALGEQQRGVTQSQSLAQLAQLQALAQLYGGLPYGALVGQSTQGTSSGSASAQGTNVTKSTPSLFQSFLDLGNMLNGFKMPGFAGG